MTEPAISPDGSVAFPVLDDELLNRLRSYGVPEDVEVGDLAITPGQVSSGLVIVDSGAVDILTAPPGDEVSELVVRHAPGAFVGELNLLTGQRTYVTARVSEAGRIHRISAEGFRRLMDEDPELSDLLLRAFLARRDLLQKGPAARSIEIIGSSLSADALALRTYAARQRLPHRWFDSETAEGQALMTAAGLAVGDLPAVLLPDQVLRRTTSGELADRIGLAYRGSADRVVDLTVIGAGPAGLAAAVYGASEGLVTVLLDSVATGGQAAASSRIENYLGFPSGLSGADLTGRAAVQALKFGAQISTPCRAADLAVTGEQLRVILGDGVEIASRAVIIASGARYRTLPLDRWSEFEGAGIYYAATEIEARICAGREVTVLGGANSAGQAALYLASRGGAVTLVARGADLFAGMSSYLADRLVADQRITVRTGTEVTGLHGAVALEGVTLTDRATASQQDQDCYGLFCFIGAEPATSWLTGQVALDEDGFIRTDVQLDPDDLDGTWESLGRSPLPFETSVPAVFAAGDVRHGSMKRVAAAVGEGASAVRSVHQAIGART
ncbi:MAG: thioredoxin reductase [Frankiales bacterium]|nr:thioredoxin reductase [Frankiales bacterium]